MALFFGHALPYMAAHNNGNLYADLVPADERVEAVSGTQELAGGCLDGRVVNLRSQVLEQLNTNLLFNSSMAGATGSVLPTNWASGSVSGLTYTISSASTVQGLRSIEWTVSGTALSDGDLWLACEPMVSGSVVAQIPSEYVGSMYCAKVSGTINAGMVLQTLTQNFINGAVQETKTKDLAAVTGQTFVRIEPNSVKTDVDLENRVNLRLYQSIASGEVIDFTIRVAAPQVEAGVAASPFISTVSGAVSEVRGRPSILVVPQLTKAGVVYPQIPVVSGADFTFTRATTATRVDSNGLIASVASGVPRIDWLGQSCPALLVEASGQNLALQSENFAASGFWALTNATINTNNDIAPDGTMTADTLSATSNSAQVQGAIVGVSGTTYTVSIYIKRRTGTGIVYLRSVENINTPITITNDWTRVYLTATATTTVVRIGINLATSGDEVDLWGAQLETGAVATTYIPTTTGSATRNADVCTVSGVSGYIGQTEGTIYAEVDVRNFVLDARIFAISDGSSGNTVRIYFLSNNVIRGNVRVGGANEAVISTASGQTAGVYKIAFAYKADDFAFYVNGSQVGTDTSGSVPACSQVFLGKLETSTSSDFLNDRIRAAAIYTTRLTNDQLESLTRLT